MERDGHPNLRVQIRDARELALDALEGHDDQRPIYARLPKLDIKLTTVRDIGMRSQPRVTLEHALFVPEAP